MATVAQRPDASSVGRLPYLALLFVVFVWGTGPVVAKLVTAPPLVAASLRFLISAPLLLAATAARRRPLGLTMLRRTTWAGLAFGVNMVFVFATLQESTVAVLTVGIALQPALLLIVVGPIFNERPTLKHVVWTLAGVVGAAAVILGAGAELRTSILGVVLAFMAMVLFSVYFVLTRLARSTTDVDPLEWMAGVTIWACVATLVPAMVGTTTSDWGALDRVDVFWLTVMAVSTGVLGHVLMGWVHGYVEAARSALMLLLMNVVAVSLAWPVHDEPVTPVQGLGGLIVLLAVAAVIRLPTRAPAGN